MQGREMPGLVHCLPGPRPLVGQARSHCPACETVGQAAGPGLEPRQEGVSWCRRNLPTSGHCF